MRLFPKYPTTLIRFAFFADDLDVFRAQEDQMRGVIDPDENREQRSDGAIGAQVSGLHQERREPVPAEFPANGD